MPNKTFDFSTGVLDPLITFNRTSQAWYFNSVGDLVNVPGLTPRFGYDPATLEKLGLLIEFSSTNTMQNNTAAGAVAGTPGTQPNLWNVDTTGNGLTRTIVGIGQEQGIDYFDIKFAGTPIASTPISIAYVGINVNSATPAQNQCFSAFYRLMAGSVAGCVFNECISASDGVAYLGDNAQVFVPTTAVLRTQRIFKVGNLNSFPGTTRVVNRCRVDVTAGIPVDFTLRIGLPQTDSSAVLSTPIKTVTAGVTRAVVEQVSCTGANFLTFYEPGPGSIITNWKGQTIVTGTVFAINAGAPEMVRSRNGVNLDALMTANNIIGGSVNVFIPGRTADQRVFSAVTYNQDYFRLAGNGILSALDTTTPLPLPFTALYFGADTGATLMGGSMMSLQYLPRVMSDEELLAATSDRALWVGGVLVSDKPAIRIVKV